MFSHDKLTMIIDHTHHVCLTWFISCRSVQSSAIVVVLGRKRRDQRSRHISGGPRKELGRLQEGPPRPNTCHRDGHQLFDWVRVISITFLVWSRQLFSLIQSTYYLQCDERRLLFANQRMQAIRQKCQRTQVWEATEMRPMNCLVSYWLPGERHASRLLREILLATILFILWQMKTIFYLMQPQKQRRICKVILSWI